MNQNLFWCVAGIWGGAIASFFISYFFYFKSSSRKCLTYYMNTICIVSDEINEIKNLEVKYNSDDIKSIYLSTIWLKNIGNSIIKKQDVISVNPISITTSGQFLKSKKEYIYEIMSEKITNYNLSYINNNLVKIEFDYIPKHAIIRLKVFHTGNIEFHGDLIDGQIINREVLYRKKRIIKYIFIILFLLLFFFVITIK